MLEIINALFDLLHARLDKLEARLDAVENTTLDHVDIVNSVHRDYSAMRNFHLDPPHGFADVIARGRKHSLHIITNARVYPATLVDLAWRFLKQHGKETS
jgi:hypothetical protein